MAGPSTLQQFPADFKKVPGTLTLTATHIAWVPQVKDQMDRQQQALARATNMLASKASSEKVSLKILFKDDIPAGGLLFTFTDPSAREDHRKAVQDTLIPFVSANRAGPSVPTPVPAAATTASPAAASPGTSNGKRKAEDGTPERAGKAARGVASRIKMRVLNKNPTLKLLHRELVLGKQITEEEFWDGREALLQTEEMAYAQKPGRASRLLDDRFDLDSGKKTTTARGGTGVGLKAKEDSGPIVLNLSKELTREIFEEFPVVQDAYAKYVPGVSEAEFWSRYFTSQLWERHRASVRQSAVDEVQRKKDDIFDQYLEDPDWNIQPRKQQPDDVERFLDLAATEEDHGESITVRDVTMQAGRERSSLPLIRRFNDHSGKLLHSGGRQGTTLSNTVIPSDMDIYNEIELEDLRGPAEASTISLQVQDAEKVVDEDDVGATKGILPGRSDEELLSLAMEEQAKLRHWYPDLREVSIPTPPGGWKEDMQSSGQSSEQSARYHAYAAQKDAAVTATSIVSHLYTAANNEHKPLAPLPESILEQMKSCHNAATEFLRQYYSSVLPSLGSTEAAAKAKAAKRDKMVQYLELTGGKINAIVHVAQVAQVDPVRVRAALAPTMLAVERALKREEKMSINGST
ncbi:TFIIH p62 subunit, N-terminal domain-domain-containing protein [Naematelia encephala]|uniref:TFIIH p62 subunit, N-terminal domain-domain-containing protein n=1 Tax=Naematelia encephala TaxID=71784 RepID=A0A1Y2AUA6_9TREE|nr:TFIIH p62 subunit, N-terminal domain-domain-containing protein [Naematelia encephala]